MVLVSISEHGTWVPASAAVKSADALETSCATTWVPASAAERGRGQERTGGVGRAGQEAYRVELYERAFLHYGSASNWKVRSPSATGRRPLPSQHPARAGLGGRLRGRIRGRIRRPAWGAGCAASARRGVACVGRAEGRHMRAAGRLRLVASCDGTQGRWLVCGGVTSSSRRAAENALRALPGPGLHTLN